MPDALEERNLSPAGDAQSQRLSQVDESRCQICSRTERDSRAGMRPSACGPPAFRRAGDWASIPQVCDSRFFSTHVLPTDTAAHHKAQWTGCRMATPPESDPAHVGHAHECGPGRSTKYDLRSRRHANDGRWPTTRRIGLYPLSAAGRNIMRTRRMLAVDGHCVSRVPQVRRSFRALRHAAGLAAP